jgi:prophage regulatory protein
VTADTAQRRAVAEGGADVRISTLLSRGDLKIKKGIPFSRQHIHRLVTEGKFPPPVKVGENTNAWLEHEVDAYLEGRIRARDEHGAPAV